MIFLKNRTTRTVRFKYIFALFTLFSSIYTYGQKHTISGYVKETGSGESLLGVVISVPSLKTGTASNNYGFYSLTLPAGSDSIDISYSSIGYQNVKMKIKVDGDKTLDISMPVESTSMQEVVIQGQRGEKVSETPQMSMIDIPIQQIKDIPALLGEKDVLKVIQLMPGVQKSGEGSSGLYVRGGGPDQNLIILDDATVYNAFHLFGFFSLFNGDALKSVELTKGGFPARYGGRLSSVIDMNMKDGNKEKIHGQVGIGLISSRLTLEGPIIKNKCSFLVSARRTYFDVLMKPFMRSNEKAGYYFYDLNAKVNYDFGRKNKLYLSGYFGKDKFFAGFKNGSSENEFALQWGNATGTLRWNHLFNNKLFANTSLIFSDYTLDISEFTKYDDDSYKLNMYSGIRDFTFKHDLEYQPSPKHSIRLGLISTYHRFTPNALVKKSSVANESEKSVTNIDVLESGIYLQDVYKPTEKLSGNIGLRLSSFFVNKKSFLNLEPRLSVAFKLRSDLSLKASYAYMNQYLNLLSNTGVGLPTDLWVPTTRDNPPQQSQQIAAGVAKDFLEKNFAITIEGYYKKSKNVIAYKEGASFMSIEDVDENKTDPFAWKNNITNGKGWSYGAEFLIQKKIGKISGWIGYTLSWTHLQFDSINQGKKFYARYDRRHDFSAVVIYKPTPKITVSGTWVYGTGNAITLPQSSFSVVQNNLNDRNDYGSYPRQVTEYTSRNGFRMAPYHRLDLGVQFHKELKWGGVRTWEVSIYNVYNRKNPYFYYTSEEYNANRSKYKTVLKQITLFPIIPSISYNLKF